MAIQRAIYELHPIRLNTVPSRAKLVTTKQNLYACDLWIRRPGCADQVTSRTMSEERARSRRSKRRAERARSTAERTLAGVGRDEGAVMEEVGGGSSLFSKEETGNRHDDCTKVLNFFGCVARLSSRSRLSTHHGGVRQRSRGAFARGEGDSGCVDSPAAATDGAKEVPLGARLRHARVTRDCRRDLHVAADRGRGRAGRARRARRPHRRSARRARRARGRDGGGGGRDD